MEIIDSKRIGCYGIVKNNNKVLLIRKKNGAYKGKLDLPGGGIEYGETAEDTIRREFIEETGLEILSFKLKTIVTNYVIWKMDDNHSENLQHYGIIYDVTVDENDIDKIKRDADGHDSLGAEWYSIDKLDIDELSPLAKSIFE